MSKLADRIVHEYNVCRFVERFGDDQTWYLMKPTTKILLRERLIDAWKVLTGRAWAIHYKSDELKTGDRD